VFYEPIVFDILGGGFDENVGGPEYREKEVLSYHVYCGVVNANGEPYFRGLCDLIDDSSFNTKEKNI